MDGTGRRSATPWTSASVPFFAGLDGLDGTDGVDGFDAGGEALSSTPSTSPQLAAPSLGSVVTVAETVWGPEKTYPADGVESKRTAPLPSSVLATLTPVWAAGATTEPGVVQVGGVWDGAFGVTDLGFAGFGGGVCSQSVTTDSLFTTA